MERVEAIYRLREIRTQKVAEIAFGARHLRTSTLKRADCMEHVDRVDADDTLESAHRVGEVELRLRIVLRAPEAETSAIVEHGEVARAEYLVIRVTDVLAISSAVFIGRAVIGVAAVLFDADRVAAERNAMRVSRNVREVVSGAVVCRGLRTICGAQKLRVFVGDYLRGGATRIEDIGDVGKGVHYASFRDARTSRAKVFPARNSEIADCGTRIEPPVSRM